MTFSRMVLSTGLVGSLLGGSLGMISPPKPAAAGDVCVCNDSGAGNYQCNDKQTACQAGSEICNLTCI